MSITFWEPHAGRVGLDYLWSRYRRLGERRNVFVRCAPNVIGFFFFFCLISTLDLPTSRLGRGFLARKLDLCLDVSLTLMASALLFFVVDTTRLCKQWITQMTAGEIRWPRPLLDGVVGKDRDLDPSAGEHFKIQLIADRTNEVGKLMYYPFIVLFLLLMARNSVFDNWNWTISIGVTYGITALGAVYCGALLRYSAEQARRKAIARVRTNLLAVSHREAKENSVESKAEAQLKNILEAIESNRRGAFCPIQENPIIHAVLIPFGGMGTLELMKLLPIFM